MKPQNVTDWVTIRAKESPYQKAVIFPQSRDPKGRVCYTHLTYAQLSDSMEDLAKRLTRFGIGKGSRCVLMVKPSLEFFSLTFALFRVGAIPVLIDPGLGIKNIKQALKEADPHAFIGIPKAHIARLVLGWQRGRIKKLITVGKKLFWDGVTLDDLLVGDAVDISSPSPPKETDQAAILFTSGSTGSPKGAVYSQRNFLSQIEALKKTYSIKPGEIDLCTFPLFALFSPALGLTAVIPEMDFTKPAKVDPSKVYEAIENFGVTNMFGSPALLKTVADDATNRGRKFPSLKRVVSAGAPVPSVTLRKACRFIADDGEIFTPYGATESLPVCSIGSNEILSDTADKTDQGHGVCVGRPVADSQVFIIKVSDKEIATWSDQLIEEKGKIGEIVVKGQQVTTSYFNRPEATRLAKILDEATGEILHRMGDLGYFDEHGRLWFCGRKNHRIKAKDLDIYTVPVEAVFNTHKLVSRSALVGVGPDGQQKPVLMVEPEKNVARSQLASLKKDLLTTAGRYSHTKSIDQIIFQEDFPVDIRHNSKIFREKLRPIAEKELLS